MRWRTLGSRLSELGRPGRPQSAVSSRGDAESISPPRPGQCDFRRTRGKPAPGRPGRRGAAAPAGGRRPPRPAPRDPRRLGRDRGGRRYRGQRRSGSGNGSGCRRGGRRADGPELAAQRVQVVGGERHVVRLQHLRADRKPRPLPRLVVPVQEPRRHDERRGRRCPVFRPVQVRLDLVGEHVPEPEHQQRAERRREQVGHEQLQRGELEDAGRQVGGRAEPDGEPAEDQDLEPVAVKVPLDLRLPRPGQELAGQGEAEHLLAVVIAEEVDDEVAEQDARHARRQGERPPHLAGLREDRRQEDRRLFGDRQAQAAQDQHQRDPEIAELSDELFRQPRTPAPQPVPRPAAARAE